MQGPNLTSLRKRAGQVQAQGILRPGDRAGNKGSDQSLMPLTWNTWHGHNLLHEYFACPSRFYFFALQGLAQGHSVKAVALELGYENTSGFVTMFRKAVGKPPARYLAQRESGRI